jgi:hypothetical protein
MLYFLSLPFFLHRLLGKVINRVLDKPILLWCISFVSKSLFLQCFLQHKREKQGVEAEGSQG